MRTIVASFCSFVKHVARSGVCVMKYIVRMPTKRSWSPSRILPMVLYLGQSGHKHSSEGSTPVQRSRKFAAGNFSREDGAIFTNRGPRGLASPPQRFKKDRAAIRAP